MDWNLYTTIFLAFYLLHNGFELVLDLLQRRHLNRRWERVPKHLEGKVDLETIRKAVAYNKDKLRLGIVGRLADTLGLWLMIFLGFAWLDRYTTGLALGPLPTGLLFFAFLGLLGILWGLPLEIAATFVVEEKHGFNRQTPMGFVVDKLKGLLVSVILGAALLSVVLLFMAHGGTWWWLYAFFGVTLLQLLLTWIYPVAIMPLFNKFTKVEGALAEDVGRLARGVGFPLKSVFSMDGSKRSAHSNAFIIGLKGARKIVLYDTLVERIGRGELLAVLAHELGHFKLKHLTRRMALVIVSLLLMFGILAVMRNLPGLYAGLGFVHGTNHAALVVFSLVVSEIVAPFGWLLRVSSRRDEFQADRFAVEAVANGYDLKEALIALNKQNLSSPGSHKLYRHYYNSHPALKERLKAIRAHAKKLGLPVVPQVGPPEELTEVPHS